MIASQEQFALPKDSKPGGTIAKQPAAGPTSRLLRDFLPRRLDSWRSRMADNFRDACAQGPEAPADASAGPHILDKDRLAELSDLMSPEELREFVWLCIVDTELRLTDIATHRASGDLEGVARVALAVAREAANLGALNAHVLALRLEAACRTGQGAGTYGLISELSEAWTQVGDSLCAWLAERASSA